MLFCALSPELPSVLAQDNQVEAIGPSKEIIVSANRIDTPVEQVASSVTVISEEDISRKQQNQLVEALKDVPGIDVVQSGPNGGNASVFIRGANSEHTLVLIDGIEANNPIATNRAFNFSNITLDNIEKIEILRGPQSTLYGSDALGGVINITTKKGAGAPTAYASFEGGGYSTLREKAGFSGGSDALSYSLAYLREDSEGISAADRRDGNLERDRFDNNSISGRVGINPTKNLESNVFIRYEGGHTDIDNNGGIGGDDPNHVLDIGQLFSRAEIKSTLFDGRLHQTLGFGLSDHKLNDDNDPDSAHPVDMVRSNYTGKLFKFDWQNVVAIDEMLTILAGIDAKQERGSSNYESNSFFGPFSDQLTEVRAQSTGYYSQAQVSLADQFFTTFGIRLDDNSRFGQKVSYRIAPTYTAPNYGTKFSSTVGTGYKAPSLSQLFSSFGNQDLKAEKSLGVDAGVEQSLFEDRLNVGLTYFWSRFRNLIDFNPDTFIFSNINESKSDGLEAAAAVNITDDLSLTVNYTLTNTKDIGTGESLLRRARNKFGGELASKIGQHGRISINVRAVGTRADNDFSTYPASRSELAGYGLVNMAASYDLSKRVQLFARLDNLFDKRYQDVLGYGTAGMTGFGGVRVNL